MHSKNNKTQFIVYIILFSIILFSFPNELKKQPSKKHSYELWESAVPDAILELDALRRMLHSKK